MDVLIIAHYAGYLDGTSNNRFEYIANLMADKGEEVELITSVFFHGRKNHETMINYPHKFKLTLLPELGYERNISLKRIYSNHLFGKAVNGYLKKRKKPDLIYCAVPSLTGPYKAAKYCKKNGVRFVIDVQDLWPEAFKMVFNIPVVSNLIFAPFTALANGVYRRADEIVAVSKTYADRAVRVNRINANSHIVFLGTQLASYDKHAKENSVERHDNSIWIGYCGTLGASYDISVVIDALALLDKNNVEFIVMGDGEKRTIFEKYAKEKGVHCRFTGRIPYSQMCGMLSACDIAVNPIMHNAAASVINKHADYAAAGIPVINTQENQEYRNLVEAYDMGFNCDNGNVEDIANKIRLLVENSALRKNKGENARRCAREMFDRSVTYKEIIDLVST